VASYWKKWNGAVDVNTKLGLRSSSTVTRRSLYGIAGGATCLLSFLSIGSFGVRFSGSVGIEEYWYMTSGQMTVDPSYRCCYAYV